MKVFLFIALCTCFLFSFGQIGTRDPGQVNSGSTISFLYKNHFPGSHVKKGNKIIKYKDISGSPYIANKQNLQHGLPTGKIHDLINNKYLGEFFIRYNAFTDNMELSSLNDGIDFFLLKKNSNAWQVTLGNKEYGVFGYTANNEYQIGFFVVVTKSDTKNYTLLKKEKVIFKDQIKEKNAFVTNSPAQFKKVKDSYYLKIGDRLQQIPKKKKDFLKLFNERKKEMESYINTNKLKINREADLVNILNHYKSLQS